MTLEKYVTLRNAVYEYMVEQESPITLLDIQQHMTSEHEGKFAKKMLQQFHLARLLDELKLDGLIALADGTEQSGMSSVYYEAKRGI
ncbi:hypothetical protein [Bacillus manliponensis]|uniref:hypothetical protein n=1 Tax=Bacillus manliponensis TaxID=574376 RepID=UPI003516D67D